MQFSLGHPSQQIFGFMTIAVPIGVKVFSAIICGGLIGLEREFKNKPAGIKTNILICLGSTLYTVVSILVARSFSETGYHGDPGRIAAQIVTGIGFIGAGTIMQSRASVVGLTTAATIWIVAAIGLCIGSGYPFVAFMFTVTVLFTLLVVDWLETKFMGRGAAFAVDVMFDDDGGKTRAAIDAVMATNGIELDDFEIARMDGYFVLSLQYSNPAAVHRKFIAELWKFPGIRDVQQV